MQQSTSPRPINVPSISELCNAPIVSVYVNGLPRGPYVHGTSVEFFFENGELSVGGDIVQVGPKEELFYLKFDQTLGLAYWRDEMVQRRGEPVIHAMDLAAEWKNQGLEALLVAPREVRLYTKSGPETMSGRLAGIEIIAKYAPSQRVLLVASEEDPGDVIVMTPSGEYSQMVSRLVPLNNPSASRSEVPD
jgi:hypothetical protein